MLWKYKKLRKNICFILFWKIEELMNGNVCIRICIRYSMFITLANVETLYRLVKKIIWRNFIFNIICIRLKLC